MVMVIVVWLKIAIVMVAASVYPAKVIKIIGMEIVFVLILVMMLRMMVFIGVKPDPNHQTVKVEILLTMIMTVEAATEISTN